MPHFSAAIGYIHDEVRNDGIEIVSLFYPRNLTVNGFSDYPPERILEGFAKLINYLRSRLSSQKYHDQVQPAGSLLLVRSLRPAALYLENSNNTTNRFDGNGG